MDQLSLKPSCSKKSINYDVTGNHDNYTKPFNILCEEEIKYSKIMPLPQLPHLNYQSDYEIYDDNNNCMLTNLNDFDLRYFNIDIDAVDESPYNNENSDCTVNDIEAIFERLTQNDKESNKEGDGVDSVFNEKIDIINLDKLQKHVNETHTSKDNSVNSYQKVFQQNISYIEHEQIKECTPIQKYCDDSHKWLGHVSSCDIEQDIKCNLIRRLSVKTNRNEIANYEEKILINDNKIPSIHNNDHHINDRNKDFVNSENKDCLLLVNDRAIIGDATKDEINSDNSDACSYHSSDFEFIDEEEAKKECKLKMGPNEIFKNADYYTKEVDDSNYKINDYFTMPRPVDNSIPSGNDFQNLFLVPNVGFPCINFEHKALSSVRGMEVSSANNTGFKCFFKGDSKYKKEADETTQIILSMYPNENRRKLHQINY